MSDIPTKAGIYAILNEITGKLYIGSAVNLRKRKNEHFSDLVAHRHSNRYLQYSFDKHGLSAFSFHVIELVGDENALLQREQYYLDDAKSYEHEKGYNIRSTAGSNLGITASDETKAKISDAKRGEKNHMYGKHHTVEAKTKLSEANRGSRNPNWGKHHTVEAKAKMSEANRGEKNHMYDKHHTVETKAKLSQAVKYALNRERDALQLLLF